MAETNNEAWEGFVKGHWNEDINVRDFIQRNYTPYDGDSSFLAGPTQATNILWGKLQALQKEERKKGGVLDMDTSIVSSITSYHLLPPAAGCSIVSRSFINCS